MRHGHPLGLNQGIGEQLKCLFLLNTRKPISEQLRNDAGARLPFPLPDGPEARARTHTHPLSLSPSLPPPAPTHTSVCLPSLSHTLYLSRSLSHTHTPLREPTLESDLGKLVLSCLVECKERHQGDVRRLRKQAPRVRRWQGSGNRQTS